MSTPQYQASSPQHQRDGSVRLNINTLAVAALVSSFCIGPTGVILGLIALHQIKNTGERGRGLAIAALVVGCVYTAIFTYLTGALLSSEGTGGYH